MIRVCSHCRRIIGSRPDKPDEEEKISHGICPQCLVILEGKLRENASSPPRVPGTAPTVASEPKLRDSSHVDPGPQYGLKAKSLCLKTKANS